MSVLLNEVKQWNTPLLGAITTWEFSKGFLNAHRKWEPPTIYHCLIAQAILTSNPLSDKINGRRTGFYSFVRSLSEPGTTDLKYSIQQRVFDKKEYTFSSIAISLSTGLVKWEPGSIQVVPNEPTTVIRVPGAIQKSAKKAALLGKWFSEIDLKAITTALEISF